MRATARINLAALERNVARLRSGLAPRTRLCAVVKADAYGHGAAACARAAMAAGAGWLAVATAEEAASLRRGGLGDAPVLVMGALDEEELDVALAARAHIVAWTEEFVEHVARAAGRGPVAVHVKLDTGMGRLGTRDRARALEVAERVLAAAPALELSGAMTHFATADEDPDFVAAQLAAFEPFVAELRARRPGIVAHAANSAATLNQPESHFDLVRCGIALYGCDPMQVDPLRRGLEPVMELQSYVAAVKAAQPGESVGYGRRFVAERETWIATVPIGYGDGVRRALGGRCDALIGGDRHPIVGNVSMDNITLALDRRDAARAGDRVVLIGALGGERQSAEDLARALGTINYEVVCGISARVPRFYHRDGVPCAP